MVALSSTCLPIMVASVSLKVETTCYWHAEELSVEIYFDGCVDRSFPELVSFRVIFRSRLRS